MPEDVVVARSIEEVLRLREAWESLPIDQPHADLDLFLAIIDERDEASRPHAVMLLDGDRPVALLASRFEVIRLVARFGYQPVFSPRVRSLTVVPGGDVVNGTGAARELAHSLLESLRKREADVVVFPFMRLGSALDTEISNAVSPLRRSHFAEVRTHRRLHLPSSFDEFLASRSRKTRSGVRYDSKRLEQRLGDRLGIKRLDSPDDIDRIF